MRAAVGIEKGDAVTPVVVDEVVNDQGVGIAPRDRNPTVARWPAIAHQTIAFEVNVFVLIVATL